MSAIKTETPTTPPARIARLEAERDCAEGREAPEGWRWYDHEWCWDNDNEDSEDEDGLTIMIAVRHGHRLKSGKWWQPYARISDFRSPSSSGHPAITDLHADTALACIEAAQQWLCDQKPKTTEQDR